MNLLNRMMSYDKTKINQENCNCKECISTEKVKSENQTVEYPKLSEEEIEQIINERYLDKDGKTKIFIRKALRKHGDRYDYSNVVYVKNDVKVEIICRIKGHKPFPQTPNNHLRGQGCKVCGNIQGHEKQKSTLEEFIENAKLIHGDLYDYSKVVYVNDATKILIICKTCKNKNRPYEFEQTPNKHLSGKGCRLCAIEKRANKRRMTLAEFIEKANKVQGLGKYDYSKVNYINAHTKVIIICPKHGGFPQTPNNHLNGQGCPICDESKGEIEVYNFLMNNHINFEREKKFKDCINIHPLLFDFYLPKFNICIEFDGGQHFSPCSFGANLTEEQLMENFKQIQFRDQIKNDYCKNNGIILIRLNNLKTVEKELIKYFQEYGIL